jgi:hypothetical protein
MDVDDLTEYIHQLRYGHDVDGISSRGAVVHTSALKDKTAAPAIEGTL